MRRSSPFLLGLALAGCTTSHEVVAPPTAERPNDGWRTLATADDRRRLGRWRNAWVDALAKARAAGHGEEIAREGALLEPDAARAGARLPPGDYRCRTIKLGAQRSGAADYSVYPARLCRVRVEGTRLHFSALDGPQRPIGALFPDNGRRLVFLGTLQLGDEALALRYSRDTERDMAGVFERVGDDRWRLVLPYPHFESLLDVIELVPSR
jgi:Domain of unknown function (DUF4893)